MREPNPMSATAQRVVADDLTTRRSVVPGRARRSLWQAAAWTGAGTAVLGTVVAIAVVALCWLPVAGTSGHAGSVLRAGVLALLAALHGGITVDGIATAFVPLGMTFALAVVARRAGFGLADAAEGMAETDTGRLLGAAAVQIGAFAAVCGVAAGFSALGTSSVLVLPAVLAAVALFGVAGTSAFVAGSALADHPAARMCARLRPAARAASAGLLVYAAAGALLVIASLLVHHDRVQVLSLQAGGGWQGAPVLLLGVLAAPNAVLAAASYLAGPGFALGAGTHVSMLSTAHGTLPAFPLLGAVPSGHGAAWPVWASAALTVVLAGVAVTCVGNVDGTASARFTQLAAAAGLAGLAALTLSWLAGGAIGSGRLRTIGASPWQAGLAVAGEIGVTGSVSLGVGMLIRAVRRRGAMTLRPASGPAATAEPVAQGEVAVESTQTPGEDRLAG